MSYYDYLKPRTRSTHPFGFYERQSEAHKIIQKKPSKSLFIFLIRIIAISMLGRYLTLILGISVSNDPRQSLLEILHNHPEGHLDPNIRAEFGHLLEEYAHQEEGGNRKDVLFTIGSSVYGIDVPLPEAIVDDSEPQQQKVEIVEFAFMKSFMKDVFLSYGVRGDRADICADVLIEADRRGIDSHGLGRLKPIYCDRMEQGILHPSPPIDIVKETDTTAFIDGNLGLGLYIGPYCMKMAIDKAKKHGIGFVVVRRSTHYGIAGYYATMATDRGCTVGQVGSAACDGVCLTF